MSLLSRETSNVKRETCFVRLAGRKRLCRRHGAALPQEILEDRCGVRAAGLKRECFRGALRDDTPARVTAFGAEIDNPVGFGDHIQVVLDHDDGIAGIHEPMQDSHEFFHIGHVQADGGLVQYIQRVR